MNPNREERQQPPPPVDSSPNLATLQQHHHPAGMVGGHIAVQAIDNESLTHPSVHLTSWQKLSRETANAPLLQRPTAPFARTEQKRALTSAVYYSECFLNGIEPKVADATAGEMQERYTKWWIGSQPSPIRPFSSQQNNALTDKPASKRKRSSRNIPMEDNNNGSCTKDLSVQALAAYVTSEDESSRDSYDRRYSDDTIRLSKYPRLAVEYPIERIEKLKTELIQNLRETGGDTNTPTFLSSLDALTSIYDSYHWDVRGKTNALDPSMLDIDGTWLSLTKPTYSDCKGRNDKGDYIYALGRMAFDMFRPTHLNCAIEGVFNRISHVSNENSSKRPFSVPRRLRHEVSSSGQGSQSLRNYDVVVSFTIEGNQTRRGTTSQDGSNHEYVVRRPIKGVLTNHGYMIPDPDVSNRLSIWFSGGTLQVQDAKQDLELWKQVFDVSAAPQRDVMEMARVLGARILLGAHLPDKMENDGSMTYCLKRPIGGHGSAFCDVLYMDDTLRIMRGHHGSIFVSTRVKTNSSVVDDYVVVDQHMDI